MRGKLLLRIRQLWLLIKVYICKLIFIISNDRKKNKLWLVVERGNDARDNGAAFFKYLNRVYDRKNLENDIRYIIKKDSPDYDKIRKYGKIVEYGSLKHLYLLNKAEYIISTHTLTYLPNELNKFITKGMIKYQSKIIFLQHGITKDYLPQLCYPYIKLDLFICGAKPEYEYIMKEFKHPKGVVGYTGFARFDNLYEIKIKKQILVMPTWRSYLNNLDEQEFRASEYYNVFNKLIMNENLIKILHEYDYELIFYPHYEVQKFIHLFKSKDRRIKIGSIANHDVQTLLKESAILITDYSSVFFDFAYMNKPVIYYQFDDADFFEKHYQRGYFNYIEMGFGKVICDQNQLIKEINSELKDNCRLKEIYINRIEKFFCIKDNKNCERILNKILEL